MAENKDPSPNKEMFSRTVRMNIPPELLTAPGKVRAPQSPAGAKRIVTRPSAERPKATLSLDENFQALFQRVYDGAVIADIHGQIVDVNVRAMDFLQYERQELQGMRMTDIISGADDGLIQSLRENLEKDLFMLIQAFCARKDGTLFPGEIAVNRLPFSNEAYLCFFIRDITQRRKAEELLLTEHNAIQNSGNGIGIATLEGRLEYVNPATARLWGYERTQELVGRDVTELLCDGTVAGLVVESVRQGQGWTGQSLGRRKDGSEFNVQISAAGNRDTDDELVGMVFSFVDISDSKRAEQAELQAERQRVMMESLGTACHHLGQPATVILTSLEIMQKLIEKDSNPGVKDLLSSSVEAATSLGQMLHALNARTEYKTKPYLEAREGSTVGETRILDF